MLLPFKLGIGGRQGSGKQWMSWIALADEVGAIRHAIEHDAVQRAGQPRRARTRSPTPSSRATLGRVLHRPTILPTPMFPLKLRFGAELVESLLLVSQRVEPAQLEATGYEFTWSSLDAALRAMLGDLTVMLTRGLT